MYGLHVWVHKLAREYSLSTHRATATYIQPDILPDIIFVIGPRRYTVILTRFEVSYGQNRRYKKINNVEVPDILS